MGASIADKPKQPYEEIQDFIEFSGRLAAGDTIASCEVTGYGSDGVVDNTIFSNVLISGTKVYFTYKGGIDGGEYKLSFRAVAAGGAKLEEDFFFTVVEY